MNDTAKDLRQLIFIVLAAVVVVVAGPSFCAGRVSGDAATRDTMRIIEVRRDTVRDTITVREKARTHWDTVVRNVSDTQVVIQRDSLPPDTVTVPVEVIRRDQAKDSLLAILYVDRRLDSLWHIQDAKLPHKASPKWAVTFGPGYACNDKGCGLGAALTFSYRIGR